MGGRYIVSRVAIGGFVTMTEIIYETVVDFFSYSLLCSINVFELGIGTILTVGSDNPKLQFLKNTSGLYGGRHQEKTCEDITPH